MAASLVRKFSGLCIGHLAQHGSLIRTGPALNLTCVTQKSLTTLSPHSNCAASGRMYLQPPKLSISMGTYNTGSLLQACLPLVQSVRTAIRYSIRRGKPKTVRAVTQRFFRLPWGIYIRTRAGRHKKKWAKPDWINERGRYHVFCNKQQSRMLDKMTCQYWKKRRYYVDDPYEPYMERTGIDYKPPKFLP